jgi:hypothetical protein
MRPLTNGPRSLMRTTMLLPVRLLITATLVPKGSLLWAADTQLGLNLSPFAVTFPLE